MLPEQLLIVFVITLLGVLVVHTLRNIMEATEELQAMKAPCGPHKWEYDHLGNMLCGECNFKPGVEL